MTEIVKNSQAWTLPTTGSLIQSYFLKQRGLQMDQLPILVYRITLHVHTVWLENWLIVRDNFIPNKILLLIIKYCS